MNLSAYGSLAALLVVFALPAFASDADPSFSIQGNGKTISFSRSELLKRKDLTEVDVAVDRGYTPFRTKMHYQAVPLAALFSSFQMKPDAIVQFHCLDGFSAPLSTEKLLNQDAKQSLAYLAIEPESTKWPVVQAGKTATPGPFYIVWVNPSASHIGQEEWPYQLASLEIKPSLRSVYPHIFPDKTMDGKNPINLGFQVFQKSCFPCHTMNREGESKMGPDLNVPMNITEYLSEKAIRTQIRDPQKLRHWPEAKMKGFPVSELSEADLNSLLKYLKHMAKNKV
jgi:cytochrome c2